MALSRIKKIAVAALGGVLLVAVGGWAMLPKQPKSIADALDFHRAELGDAYCVLLPLSTETRLGHRALNERTPGKKECRLDIEPNPCFFTPPATSNPSIPEMTVQYESSQLFTAELSSLVHGGAAASGKARLELRDLSLAHAIGVIDPNGICKKPGVYSIVTGVVVAGTADLTSDNTMSANAASSVATRPDAGIVSANTALTGVDGQHMTGKNLVLGGLVQKFEVTKLAMRGTDDVEKGISLSENPLVGRREDLPDGVHGYVSVGAYSFTDLWLDLTVNVPMGASTSPPAGMKTCAVGTSERMTVNQECNYLFGGGSTLLQVSWHRDAAQNVVLSMVAFSSTPLP
ncbi:MAG: hypothetical protein ABJE95_26925 [Byssovorax sp.]